MFTGIVEEVGRVRRILAGAQSGEIAIAATHVLEGTRIGDSIAVDGVCLTVTSLASDGFTADATPETLRRSTLGALAPNAPVNLERAMLAGGRFGGHIVQGHVDATGTLRAVKAEGNARMLWIDAPASVLALVAEKGSIAVDGVSLTVASLDSAGFSIAMIPHTGQATALLQKRPGSRVNLETDVLAKYVQRLLHPDPPPGGSPKKELTLAFLQENGF